MDTEHTTFSKVEIENKKAYVGDSLIHGKGVMAKKDIKKGETVFVIKGKVIHWIVSDEESSLFGNHWIGLGRDTWIEPVGFGLYLNHSFNPSCGIKGKLMVCALREIKKGEEITIDYSITEEDTLWWMEDCISGKKVRSIQSLTLDKYTNYLPYIPKYFQKVYNKNIKKRYNKNDNEH